MFTTFRAAPRRLFPVFAWVPLTALALGACASPRPRSSFSSNPQSTVTPSHEASVELPAGEVSLAQLLAYAHTHAPALVRARGRLALGDAERVAADVVRYDPVVDVGLGVREQGGATGLDAQVALSQQLELSGQRRLRRAAAEQVQALRTAGVDVAAWSVHAEVHLAFSRALLAEDVLSLADDRRALALKLQTMTETKVTAGEEPAVALELARAEVALAENLRTRAEASLSTARLALARAAGVPDRPLTPRGDHPGLVLIDDAAHWVAQAQQANPTLRRAHARVAVADARVDVAARDARPAPSFGVQYTREGSTSRPGNPSPPSNIVMGTVSVPIPAFNRNRGAVARRQAEAQVARSDQRALQLELDQATRMACVQVDATARRVQRLTTDVVGAFSRAVAALERAYAVGERDFVSVAQSMQRLWSAREQALVARSEHLVAVAELETLVGPLKSGGER